jgi:hypothetical protein
MCRVAVWLVPNDICYDDLQFGFRSLLQLVLLLRITPTLPGWPLRPLEHGANCPGVAKTFTIALLGQTPSDDSTDSVAYLKFFVVAHFLPNTLQFELRKIVKFHGAKAVGHPCRSLRRAAITIQKHH